MADTFNPIMKNCRVVLYGGLFLRMNNKILAYNEISFGFTLPYILFQLGTHHITSVKPNEYVYYKFTFGVKEYDLRDKQQFLKLRDTIRNAYNNWVEFFKNKEKNKNAEY